jgi:RNA polymerase sigma-70 factor (ECF subfamily)
LNRAIVLAQIEGAEAGLRELEAAGADAAFRHYPLFDAALGELCRRAGDFERARRHFEAALARTSSPFERELLTRRLKQCSSEPA